MRSRSWSNTKTGTPSPKRQDDEESEEDLLEDDEAVRHDEDRQNREREGGVVRGLSGAARG